MNNIVEANICAAQAEGVSGKVYNIACGDSMSILDLLREICCLLEKPFDPIFFPSRVGDVMHSWADISAAKRDLGFSVQLDFREGLRQTVEYYLHQASASPCAKPC